ncbi:hypothetical protein GQ54DRAFT_43662 [Martensiomyces pterosporus]|nr:hypothetical protein GQ54DRAFT_96531 [Martensiomyces pterosporus]KAI8319297.1 hypothetical protein GQ54DRAFT_43662 [Martensiomyces pterosporus]
MLGGQVTQHLHSRCYTGYPSAPSLCRASWAPRHTPPLVPETESWHAFRIAFCKVELLSLRSDVQHSSLIAGCQSLFVPAPGHLNGSHRVPMVFRRCWGWPQILGRDMQKYFADPAFPLSVSLASQTAALLSF